MGEGPGGEKRKNGRTKEEEKGGRAKGHKPGGQLLRESFSIKTRKEGSLPGSILDFIGPVAK